VVDVLPQRRGLHHPSVCPAALPTLGRREAAAHPAAAWLAPVHSRIRELAGASQPALGVLAGSTEHQLGGSAGYRWLWGCSL